jgi:hypothetical protein
VQVAQRDGDADAHVVAPSNIAAVWVPAGTNTNRVIIEPVQTRQSLPGHQVFAGLDLRLLAEQTNSPTTALPSSIAINGPIVPMTRNAPNFAARRVRVKYKHIIHSGVAGIQVQSVIAPNQIRTSELIGSPQTWTGQILSVVADASDGSVPLWNFTITDFDNITGTFTVSPDCVRAEAENSVQANDVMIIRSRATAATASSITNGLWQNSVAANQNPDALNGLVPGEEVGLLVRIIAGKGKGQVRPCEANDNVTHWVIPPWTVQPDTTSIYIVEMPDWMYTAESSDTPVDAQNDRVEIAAQVDNLDNFVVLAGGFLVDEAERETFEELGVYREIFVFGQPYEVRTTAGGTDQADLTDQTIRVDTSAGDVVLDLPYLGPYFGRSMLIVNDGVGTGAGRVLIHPVGSDQFATGETEIILTNPGDWCEFVAAGDKTQTVGRFQSKRYLQPQSVWNRMGRPRQHPRYRQRRGLTLPRATKRFPGRIPSAENQEAGTGVSPGDLTRRGEEKD